MSKITNETEAFQLLRAGDSRALESIWQLYANDLLAYLISLLHSKQDAEDVLQDVFIEIAKKHTQVAKAKDLKSYLFRMSRNTAFNSFKKTKQRLVREENFSFSMHPEEVGDGDEEADLKKQLINVMASLPEKQRVVLALRFYGGKTLCEIAKMLGVSENTAGSRYRYGMLKLKKLMNTTG